MNFLSVCKKAVLVASALILFFPAGCGRKGKQEETTFDAGSVKYPSEPADDLFITTLRDSDITIYKDLGMSSQIMFYILTKGELGGITLDIDAETPYTYDIFEVPNEYVSSVYGKYFPKYLFSCYQGMDWKYYYELSEPACREADEGTWSSTIKMESPNSQGMV